MSPTGELLLRVVREGLLLVVLVSAPPLLASLLVGLVTGVLQAATQIQDQAVGFVPKLVVVIAILIVVGPMLGSQVVRFAQAAFAAVVVVR